MRAFPADIAAPAAARQLLRETRCPVHDCSPDEVLLLLSETVTNAVRHAGPPIIVTSECLTTAHRIGVHDGDPALPDPSTATRAGEIDPEDLFDLPESGRGLDLLDSLAATWHVEPDAEGKTVWFDVAC